MTRPCVTGTINDMRTRTAARAKARSQWGVPAGLLALSVIPIVGGARRVSELAGGAPVTPENARFFDAPVPVLVHIVGATMYCVLGAFQFVPSLRRQRWHRVAGRLLVPCGLAAALSGVWMSLFYALPPGDEGLLTVFRVLFGSGMAAAIVLAFTAIRRRDVLSHRAWMMRGYALGLGAGTQAVLFLTWFAVAGAPDDFTSTLLMGAGWAINLAMAERIIRAKRATRTAVAQ